MHREHAPTADILADPFRERRARRAPLRSQLLGARFEFECETAALRRLVESAYAGVPRHRLLEDAPRIRVRLALAPEGRAARARAPRRDEPPALGMCSGADFLCGTTASSSFAVVSSAQRAGLVVLSREMLRFPYHARYEVLELAVFTLAARVQNLLPLHSACVGRRGRGILLMGESGAGKSTASLHCLLRGCDFVAEDSVFVEPRSMRATGVANFLHLRRASLRFVPDAVAERIARSPVIRRRSGVAKLEVDARRHGFRLAPRPVGVHAVVFASGRSAEGGPLLVRLSGAETARRLEAEQPYAASLHGWRRFERAVRAMPAFELRRGHHPLQSAEALDTLLAGRGHRSGA